MEKPPAGEANIYAFLSWLLDTMPSQGLQKLVLHLWPEHTNFRSVIGQWLDSGNFTSTYFREQTGLLWTPCTSTSYEDIILQFDPDGVAEAKRAPGKRDHPDSSESPSEKRSSKTSPSSFSG